MADDYGLDWHYYGFRVYDAAIGRFPSIDPIADNFAHVSGYNYAENRVPNGIDLYGLQFSYNGIAREEIRQKRGEAAAKEYDQGQKAATMEVLNIITDEIPLVGEGKAIAQGDYIGVAIGIIPFGSLLYKSYKKAKKAKKAQKGFDKFKNQECCPDVKSNTKGGTSDLSDRKRVPKDEAWINMTNPTPKGHQKGGTLTRDGDDYLKAGPEGFTKEPLPTTHTSTGNPSNYMERPLDNLGKLLNDKIKDIDPGGD